MKNFEKYEKEIKIALSELDHFKEATILGEYERIAKKECRSYIEIANWLYEEYKEPLLTDEEKEYLKAVIKPFRDEVLNIVFYINHLIIHTANEDVVIPVNMVKHNLNYDEIYSLRELGL